MIEPLDPHQGITLRRLLSVDLFEHGGCGRLHSGASETHEVVLRSSTAFRLASTECSATSSLCESKVGTWQRSELTDVTAKVVIYEAFVEGRLEAPKHLARTVHDLYFEPKYDRPSFKIGNCYERDHTCTLKQSLDSTLTKLAHCDRPFVVPSSAPMTRCRQGVAWKGRNAAPSCFSALAEVT